MSPQPCRGEFRQRWIHVELLEFMQSSWRFFLSESLLQPSGGLGSRAVRHVHAVAKVG